MKKRVAIIKKLSAIWIFEPHEFLMIGKSLKSDILPVLKMGGAAIHIPLHTTWVHEQVHRDAMEGKEYETLSPVSEIIPLLL